MSEKSNTPDSSEGLVPMPSSKLRTMHVRSAPSGSGGSHPPMTARFVLNAVRQWWKVAAPVGLVLAAVAAALIYMFFEPVYESSSWLRIYETTPYIAFQSRDDSRRFIETQVQLIRSPMVIAPVISQPEIAGVPEIEEQDSPVEWLGRQIQVKPVGQSELFRISFASPDPENSARIVNAVVNAYFNLRSQDDAERVQRVIELLDEERERRSSEVARLRENVREMAKEATGKDPFAANPASDTSVNHPLAELQSRLTTAEVEEEILKAQVQAVEELTSKQKVEVPDGMVERAVEEHAEVQRLRALLLAKRSKLHEIETRSAKGDKDPFYQQLFKEITLDEKALEQVRNELRGQVRLEMETALINRRKDDLAQMRSRLEGYQTMQEVLQERYKSKLKDVKQFSGETLELEFRRAELARAEEVFDLITARTVRLRTEQRAPTRVKLLRPAEVSATPVELVPYKQMVLLSLVCLCLPFGLAILWERVVRRVSDIEHIEQDPSLEVIGEIACLPVRVGASRGSSSRRVGRGLRMFEESIDSLRTSLMLSEVMQDGRVVLVTSATTREGKTTVAAQLAVSIARASGQPTLLIDADMRSPDIHKVFEIPLEPGLAKVLGRECTLEDAVVSNWGNHVDLLPAGRLHASPHKLLGNGAANLFLEEIPAAYRYVIIDTPPVLAASESLVLASVADVCLVCAMRDVSRVDQVRRTCQRLVAAGTPAIGAVLNGIPAKQYAYRYGSYGYFAKEGRATS